MLSNPTHGKYTVTFPQTVFAVKVEGITLRCSNPDALEPSQRELVDEVLAPVRSLDAPVLQRANSNVFREKLQAAGLEPAEAQTAPADAPKANKRGHEARDAQDSRNKRVEQEQAPEPQPLNLEACGIGRR